MKMKKLVSIVIAFVLVFALGMTAFASSGSKTAELFFRDIKISLNGKEITPKDADGNAVEPFIIDGTTYLPVRAVAGTLGLDVDWDGETNTVILKEKGYTEGSNYSRLNPAPIGTKQSFSVSDYSEEYTATAVINSVVSGGAAWDMVKAANMFNSEASEGMEYIVADISITLVSSKGDKAVSFNEYSFDVYSSDNVEYESSFVVAPAPTLTGNVFPGGTSTGYVVFAVSQTDEHPKVVIGADYRGNGGVWFSLR